MSSFKQIFSRLSLVMAMAFSLVAVQSARAESPDPVAIIRKKDAELQKMLRDKEQVKNTQQKQL